jgi:phosphonate transport system substrate-binding protein
MWKDGRMRRVVLLAVWLAAAQAEAQQPKGKPAKAAPAKKAPAAKPPPEPEPTPEPLPTAAPLPPPPAPGAPLTLGLFNPLGKDAAEKSAKMLRSYLTAALSREIKTVVYDTYDDAANALAQGQVDFAWLTPVAFVRALAANKDLQPIAKAARGNGITYRSAIIVRGGSEVKSLADLKGVKIAWVDKNSASGYILPSRMLQQAGVTPGEEVFAGNHRKVCEAVALGNVDAGATLSNERFGADPPVPDACVESLGADAAAKLRIVALSDPIPNEVIAARAGLGEEARLQIVVALASLPDNKGGVTVLKEVFHAEGFVEAVSGDFDSLRKLLQ